MTASGQLPFFRDVFWARTVWRREEGEEISKGGSNCGFAPINIYWISLLQAGLLQSFRVCIQRVSTFWQIVFRHALCHVWKSCKIKASKFFTSKISNMDHLLLLQPYPSRQTSDWELSKPEPLALWRTEVVCSPFPDQTYKLLQMLQELHFRYDTHHSNLSCPGP